MSERPKSSRLGALQGSRAGETVQLGSDFLEYARKRYDPSEFKDALVQRLLPTVPLRGRPLRVKPREPFGKFNVLGRLGKGGMAEVYLAEDPEREPGASTDRERHVALKVMKTTIAHDPHYVKRFLREAANAALIEHPNVVTIFEVGAVEGRLYFTMELIEGETLKERLQEGTLSEEDGVVVLMQLLDGLLAAHEHGIGHRDIKPSNVMLVNSRARYGVELRDVFDVHVKVTDFGLAQMLEIDQTESLEGRFLGTAKYVAPEVIRGKDATLKSDVFSLGIMAFQVFSGTTPWRAKNKVDYITANLDHDAPRLSDRVEVSEGLSDVVDRMLAKDPDQRPDVAQLRRALGRLVARDHGFGGDLFSDDADRERGPDPSAAWDAPPTVVLAVFTLLIVLGVALLMAYSGDDTSLPKPATDSPPSVDDPLAEGPDAPPPDVETASLAVRQFGELKTLGSVSQELLERGDAAWETGSSEEALATWESAAQGLRRPPTPLAVRLQTARRTVSLAEAKRATARGDLHAAYCALDRATAAGAEPEVVARRDALWVQLEQRQSVLAKLRTLHDVPRGARPAARKALSELRADAEEAGLSEAWEEAAERLGGAGGPGGRLELSPGCFVRSEPVSNREFHAWYRQASKDEFLAPPAGWAGEAAPTEPTVDDPVLGVRVATARAYAQTLGQRLATTEELELLRGEGFDARDPEEDRYLGGFWTVQVE